MENERSQNHIGIAGIARSGSDSTCMDGKCNEVIGLEFRNGSFVPYQPTPYTLMPIGEISAKRVWIHRTSLQRNWVALGGDGYLYWGKERESEEDEAVTWTKVTNTRDSYWSAGMKIDFIGNMIALGNSSYYLFLGADDEHPLGRYQKFTRDSVKFSATFGTSLDKVYGIRSRYRWDALSEMKTNPAEGFADTLCGLFNKLDSEAVSDNRVIGHAFVRYAFRLYDGSYLYASAPVYIHAVSRSARLWYNDDDFVWDSKDRAQAAPLFGRVGSYVLGEELNVGTFKPYMHGRGSTVVHFNGLQSSTLPIYGAFRSKESKEPSNFLRKSVVDQRVMRKYCAALYGNSDNLKPENEVMEISGSLDGDEPLTQLGDTQSLPEETGWFSCLANVNDGGEGTHDWVDCYALRRAMKIRFGQFSKMNEGLKDFILSVDVFMTRPVSSFVTDSVEMLDMQQCAAHREIKKPAVLEDELHESMRAFYKIASIPYEDILKKQKGAYDTADACWSYDLDDYMTGAVIENITAKQTLEEHNAHEVDYGISYTYNQKIHIADFSTRLYGFNGLQGQELNQPDRYDLAYMAALMAYVKQEFGLLTSLQCARYYYGTVLNISGEEHTVNCTYWTDYNNGWLMMKYRMGSCYFYPDTRAVRLLLGVTFRDETGNYYSAVKTLPLRASDTINYAYSFDISDSISLYGSTSMAQYALDHPSTPATEFVSEGWTLNRGLVDFAPAESAVARGEKQNTMRVSSVGNPIIFPFAATYTIGDGDIIGLSSNAIALSQGQFGEHPLFVFTTDGIWAMRVDSTGGGSYISQEPISREVCNNADSICQTDDGVVFSSEKGLMMISGRDVKFLSEHVNGKPNFIGNRVLSTAVSHYKLTTLVDFVSELDFKDYLCKEGSFVTFLYKKNKLLISNGGMRYSYLYDIGSGTTTKLAAQYGYRISDYPNDKLVSAYDIDTFPIDTLAGRSVQTLIQTRPLKLGNQDFKASFRAVVRGDLSTGDSFRKATVNLPSGEYAPSYTEYLFNPNTVEETYSIVKNGKTPVTLAYRTLNDYYWRINLDYTKFSFTDASIKEGDTAVKSTETRDYVNLELAIEQSLTDVTLEAGFINVSAVVSGYKATLLLKDSADETYEKTVEANINVTIELPVWSGSALTFDASLAERVQNDAGTIYVDSVTGTTRGTTTGVYVSRVHLAVGHHEIALQMKDEDGVDKEVQYRLNVATPRDVGEEGVDAKDTLPAIFEALYGESPYIAAAGAGYKAEYGNDYKVTLDRTETLGFRYLGEETEDFTYESLLAGLDGAVDIPEYVLDGVTTGDERLVTLLYGKGVSVSVNGVTVTGPVVAGGIFTCDTLARFIEEDGARLFIDKFPDVSDIEDQSRSLTIKSGEYVHIKDNINNKERYVRNAAVGLSVTRTLKELYGEQKPDYVRLSDTPFEYADEREISVPNGSELVTFVAEGESYTVLYTGPNVTRIGDLVEELRNGKYKTFAGQKAEDKAAGIYVFGSNDCKKWGFLGGTERRGDGIRDIGTTIERVSCKFVMVAFAGELKETSRIDYIDLSAQQKYEEKLR